MQTSRFPKTIASWLCLILPFVIGLGSDLLLKSWSFNSLVKSTYIDPEGRMQVNSVEHELIPNILTLHSHVNYGAVFGIGQGNRILFVIVSVMAIALLFFLFIKSAKQYTYQILLGMLLAGVLGNFYDRIVYGYVRDMIYAFPNRDIFPWIFNIADSLLCTGVGGMFIYSIFHREPIAEKTEQVPTKA
ncbi:MAG: signal peptidase II [Pirellulales bacterium]